jgi:hypothetical protein
MRLDRIYRVQNNGWAEPGQRMPLDGYEMQQHDMGPQTTGAATTMISYGASIQCKSEDGNDVRVTPKMKCMRQGACFL